MRILLIFLFTTLSILSLAAQVQYQLDYLVEEDRYQLSLVSSETYPSPQNMIGTFQATFVVPTGTAELTDLQNLVPGVLFSINSVSRAPQAAPGFDYFSVGLVTMATTAIPLTAATSQPIFTFANTLDCTAPIALIDHATDPFFLDPDKSANVGNSISLAYTVSDVYSGNVDLGTANCATTTGTKGQRRFRQLRAYPNPVIDRVYVELDNGSEPSRAELQLVDQSGRIVIRQTTRITAGVQTHELAATQLAVGAYRVLLVEATQTTEIGTVVKVE